MEINITVIRTGLLMRLVTRLTSYQTWPISSCSKTRGPSSFPWATRNKQNQLTYLQRLHIWIYE